MCAVYVLILYFFNGVIAGVQLQDEYVFIINHRIFNNYLVKFYFHSKNIDSKYDLGRLSGIICAK